MTKTIEAIKAFHECRNFGTRDNLRNAQQEVAAAYRSLSPEECSTLADNGITNAEEDVLSHLACLRPGSLAGHHVALAERGMIYGVGKPKHADFVFADWWTSYLGTGCGVSPLSVMPTANGFHRPTEQRGLRGCRGHLLRLRLS